MKTKRILACLDIDQDRVVKGVQFLNLEEMGDPAALAEAYCKEGADELAFYDITASMQNRSIFLEVLKKVAEKTTVPLMVGGGIRSLDDFEMVIAAGADSVSINSGTIERPELLSEAAAKFGSSRVVLSVDVGKVGDDYHVFRKGGQEDIGWNALDWMQRAVALGAGTVVVNCIDSDGMNQGYDICFLKKVCQNVSVPIVASGGAGSVVDFIQLFREIPEMDTALAASVFHKGLLSIREVKKALRKDGFQVR